MAKSKVNVIKTKDIVIEKLTKYPHLRDNDDKLIANIWFSDVRKMGLNPEKISAKEFMQFYADGKLTSSESIRRSRQKVQEHREDLRGEKYAERHGNTHNVKEDLKNTENNLNN